MYESVLFAAASPIFSCFNYMIDMYFSMIMEDNQSQIARIILFKLATLHSYKFYSFHTLSIGVYIGHGWVLLHSVVYVHSGGFMQRTTHQLEDGGLCMLTPYLCTLAL